MCAALSAQPVRPRIPVLDGPASGQRTINLPGGVPLVLERATTACAGGGTCWVARDPLTYRQWFAIMGTSRFPDVAPQELDRPIESLTPADVSGDKGFLAALAAYQEKFPGDAPMKFGGPVTPLPQAQANSTGVHITATMASNKSLQPITDAACTFGGASGISCGQTRSGSLSVSDCTLGDGSYADVYSFSGTSGEQVTINLSSTAFDTYLLLYDPSGSLAMTDDDSGPGLNSQIAYTLTATGTWYIVANSLHAGDTGAYDVLLSCDNGNTNCNVGTTSCGATVSGALSTSDCQLSDGSYVDFYQFSGTAGTTVTIDLSSSAFDTYLVLLDPNANLAAFDDDSGGALNSRIVYTLTSSGNWVIGANSLHGGATGGYSLHTSCGNPTSSCTYTLGSSSASYGSGGGSGSVQVSGSPSNCTGSWSSISNASWLGITSGSGGSGAGPFTLNYSVGSNSSSSSRNGSMTVAGHTFTVTQSGQSTGVCTPSSTRACLLNGRFAATVRFRGGFDNGSADTNAFVKSVSGFASPNFETAFFYFNSDNNIEMLLKMLDQGNTDGAGHPTIAVLFGTATPLRIELSITDTQTGITRTYSSDFSAMRGVTDFTAFLK
ncbi:MAG: PPC domain-containing protein [Acidobacteria bacterium]|nr:PPC domain-containing protein [Acidobacteriota bacterium]